MPFYFFRRVTDHERFRVGQDQWGYAHPPPGKRHPSKGHVTIAREPHTRGGRGAKRQRDQPNTKPKLTKETKDWHMLNLSLLRTLWFSPLGGWSASALVTATGCYLEDLE